jgi:hypothetical protein
MPVQGDNHSLLLFQHDESSLFAIDWDKWSRCHSFSSQAPGNGAPLSCPPERDVQDCRIGHPELGMGGPWAISRMKINRWGRDIEVVLLSMPVIAAQTGSVCAASRDIDGVQRGHDNNLRRGSEFESNHRFAHV